MDVPMPIMPNAQSGGPSGRGRMNPGIRNCAAIDCVFNRGGKCATAITVDEKAGCATYRPRSGDPTPGGMRDSTSPRPRRIPPAL